MRILVISPLLPIPPYTGGALRIAYLVRALAREHEVTLVAAAPRGTAIGRACEALAPVTVKVVRAGWVPGEPPSWSKRWLQVRSLFTRQSAQYWTFTRALQRAVQPEDLAVYDVVQVEYSVLGLLPIAEQLPLVLDAHNVEYRVLLRTAAHVSPWRRTWLRWEARRLRRDEETAWRHATFCLATSQVDAEEIARTSQRPVVVVPNGVDVDRFPFPDVDSAEPDHVVFVGTYRYFPNVDAVHWFVREIWPRIRAARPAARCSLVGMDPPASVCSLADVPGVDVVGTVPDVQPWLARATVVVVPLRSGSGTRLKILEAFAAGRPVVSTRIGAEGLAVEHGIHLLLADDPVSFAEAVIQLLADREQRWSLARAARELVEREYAWPRVGEKLLAVYRELAAGGGR
ncbi:glycosyltransferase family 4 protein [Thermomicrobium sp. 4228-Ro]|uniref:glycosyltransferase family 4 protein n=1 Tax=Thermomicrobium sp. 4228-Ro TaxID=2993937 RepID=UPI00224975CB|nr:glycosyltransferase family 4 protein [Thermomicrobium sp. 4228-Ro]MCX2726416.1 glycosyltransferase family 4 protein [Thermomicrobium sp. 4228-Ro]